LPETSVLTAFQRFELRDGSLGLSFRRSQGWRQIAGRASGNGPFL